MSDIRMTFGAFRGEPIGNVPDSYLIWMVKKPLNDQFFSDPWATKHFNVSAELEAEARLELRRRGFTCKGTRWFKL